MARNCDYCCDAKNRTRFFEVLRENYNATHAYGDCLRSPGLPKIPYGGICNVAKDYLFYSSIENQYSRYADIYRPRKTWPFFVGQV